MGTPHRLRARPVGLTTAVAAIAATLGACGAGSDQAIVELQPNDVHIANAHVERDGDVGIVSMLLDSPTGDQLVYVEANATVAERAVVVAGDLAAVPLPAHRDVQLGATGPHVRLEAFNHDLAVGGSFDLTLHFETSTPRTVRVSVGEPSSPPVVDS